jgi:chromosome segregation and condensation protein ScpB
MSTAGTDIDEPTTAQRLGESYAALVGGTDWLVDEIPAMLLGEPEAQATVVPTLVANASCSPPPFAEAANEPNVPPSPIQILESLLFVGGAALTAEHAADVIRGLSAEQFRDCIDTLNRVYRTQNRPYAVVPGPTGYILRVSRKYNAVKERLYGGPREARLNQPALDVLSLIAYRQPVGKVVIDGTRGVDSGPVLRQLVRLGLIATTEGNAKDGPYATTSRFLEVFRLRELDDLPQLGEPERIG